MDTPQILCQSRLADIFSTINFLSVALWIFSFLAIFDLDIFLSNIPWMTSSLPDNFNFADLRPLGRPKITPSAFFRARASFVLAEIRFLSIWADNPNAKAKTWEFILLPNS